MTILSMAQQACRRIGLASPSALLSSTDDTYVQLVALANEEGEELAERFAWKALIKEATFTTVAAASQGAMTTLAGTDFKYIINDTIWNRTTRRPVFGPLAPRDWQALQAAPVTGPYHQFRIRIGNLYFNPTPSAGDSCAFEYLSKNWCQSSGGTGQSAWAADTDTGVLDEQLMTAGLIWRWKQVKGLDYAEDYAKYERRVADTMGRDGSRGVLDMAGGITDYRPGLFVPQGNWSL